MMSGMMPGMTHGMTPGMMPGMTPAMTPGTQSNLAQSDPEIKKVLSSLQRQEDQASAAIDQIREDLRVLRDAFSAYKLDEKEQRVAGDRTEREQRKEAILSLREMLLDEKRAMAESFDTDSKQLSEGLKKID